MYDKKLYKAETFSFMKKKNNFLRSSLQRDEAGVANEP